MESQFASYVNANPSLQLQPTAATPSHLLSPTKAVEIQLSALFRNDWPESDAGVRTAFAFAMPHEPEELHPLAHTRVRSYEATERWLNIKQFTDLVHSPPYNLLIGGDSWELIGNLVFPSHRFPNKAVQVVEVARIGLKHRFTYCLEKVATGRYKNCWLVVGIRVGDYGTTL